MNINKTVSKIVNSTQPHPCTPFVKSPPLFYPRLLLVKHYGSAAANVAIKLRYIYYCQVRSISAINLFLEWWFHAILFSFIGCTANIEGSESIQFTWLKFVPAGTGSNSKVCYCIIDIIILSPFFLRAKFWGLGKLKITLLLRCNMTRT